MATSRSTRIYWTIVALGTGVVAAAGPARAADTPNPTVVISGTTHTIKAVAHQTKMLTNGRATSADAMAKPTPGDTWEFADDLNQGGVKVGSDSVHCTVAAVDKLSCVATTTFSNGTLVVKGTAPMSMDDNASFDVPIVSGTGAYDGATGTFHLANVPGTKGADANLTFTYATTSASPRATSAATKSATQVSKVPAGGADTGGGSTAGVEDGWLFGLAALTALAGVGTLALGRRGH
jgi:hypothetical protein